MRDRARVVVIGGGVGGCSILYWLARLGFEDALLVERAKERAPALAAPAYQCISRGAGVIEEHFAGARRALPHQFEAAHLNGGLLARCKDER